MRCKFTDRCRAASGATIWPRAPAQTSAAELVEEGSKSTATPELGGGRTGPKQSFSAVAMFHPR